MGKQKKTGSLNLKSKLINANHVSSTLPTHSILKARGFKVATILDRLVEVQKKFFLAEAKAVTKDANIKAAIAKINENGIEISVDKYGYFTAKTEYTNKRPLHVNRTVKIEALNNTLKSASQHLHPEVI